jgi:hypothetical protein
MYETPSIRLIAETAAEYFGITHAELVSIRRDRHLLRARQITAGLARKLTSKSFPIIGMALGGRDHTTVINQLRRYDHRCAVEPDFAADAEAIWTMVLAAQLSCELLRRRPFEDEEQIDPVEVAKRVIADGSAPIARNELIALARVILAKPEDDREPAADDAEAPAGEPPPDDEPPGVPEPAPEPEPESAPPTLEREALIAARELLDALDARDEASFADRGTITNARNRARRARANLAVFLKPSQPAEQRRAAS